VIIDCNNLTVLLRPCRAWSVIAVAFLLVGLCANADDASEAKQLRLDWFRGARFGLFIHWGLYSVPAGEWEGHKNYAEWIQLQTKMPASDYEKYAAQFNPVKFDARE
jgi:alpha-L-fucosidase